MNHIVFEGGSWRGTLPQVIVKPGRDGGRFASSDGFAVVGIPCLGKIWTADCSAMDFPDSLHHLRPRPSLVSHLDHAFIFLCRLYYQFTLFRIVTAGLFQVDMLSRFTGKNRRGRMPVVGRGNNERVEILILQRFSEIGRSFWTFLLYGFELRDT